jgi:hypothetical protein
MPYSFVWITFVQIYKLFGLIILDMMKLQIINVILRFIGEPLHKKKAQRCDVPSYIIMCDDPYSPIYQSVLVVPLLLTHSA